MSGAATVYMASPLNLDRLACVSRALRRPSREREQTERTQRERKEIRRRKKHEFSEKRSKPKNNIDLASSVRSASAPRDRGRRGGGGAIPVTTTFFDFVSKKDFWTSLASHSRCGLDRTFSGLSCARACGVRVA